MENLTKRTFYGKFACKLFLIFIAQWARGALMPLAVTFTFTDDNGRSTNRTWTTTSATVADALTDVTAFVVKLTAAFDCGLSGVIITEKSAADDFAAVGNSNIDEGATFKVTAEDGFAYNIKIPIPKAVIRAGGGAIDLTDALVIAFVDQWKTAGKWRVNVRNPQFVVTVDKGLLDA